MMSTVPAPGEPMARQITVEEDGRLPRRAHLSIPLDPTEAAVSSAGPVGKRATGRGRGGLRIGYARAARPRSSGAGPWLASGDMALRSGEIRAETCTRGNGSRNGSVNQQVDRRPAQVLGTHNSEDLRGPCRAAREADRARLERRRLQLYQV